ncbi:MAG: HAMP domain-containing sensor histidine kinase [Sulfurospirillum sp.]
MKSSEKKLIYLNTLFVFIFAIFIFFSGFLIDKSLFSTEIKYIIVFLSIILIMLLSYHLSRYFLGKSFKTNYLLNLLLKDTLHELNIPLSVIKANTQMLLTNEKDEKKLKRYDRIQKASDELFNLYEDVDYYIKKETKNEVREEFELSNFLLMEVEKFAILYPDVKIKCELESMDVYTDKRGFQKVFSNLLGNALKYNQNNNDISVVLGYNELTIEDRGIGMSESDLFLIFDRYYQGEQNKKGYGIGLSIVKTFCDESNIRVKIDSKLGIGTKISLGLNSLMVKG